MKLGTIILILTLTLLAGGALGAVFAGGNASAPISAVGALELSAETRADYISDVAAAYAANGDLKLAQDRLARLREPQIAAQVEQLALETANQRDANARQLARLAVALGSEIKGLVALYESPTPAPTRAATATSNLIFSNVRATQTPYLTETAIPPTPTITQAPKYVVVPNDNPYIILPTDTPTITPTRRPATRVPTATLTPIPTEIPPPHRRNGSPVSPAVGLPACISFPRTRSRAKNIGASSRRSIAISSKKISAAPTVRAIAAARAFTL